MPTDKELQDLYRRAELAGVLDGDKELRDLTNRASAAGLISGISGEEKDAYRTGKASSQLQGSAVNLRRTPGTNQRTPKLPGVTFRDPQTKKTTGRISPVVGQGDVRQVDRKDEAFIKSLSSMKGQTPEQLRAQDINAPRFSNKSIGRDIRDMVGAEADALFMYPEAVRRRMAGDSKGAAKIVKQGQKAQGDSLTARAIGGALGGSIQQGEGGAASRNFTKGALPGAGGLAGFSAGARIGASVPAPAPVKAISGLAGGLLGAFGGGAAMAGAQRGLDRFLLGEEGLKALDAQSAVDQRDNPLASSIGQASTALLFGKPTADDIKAIPQIVGMVRGGIPLRVALASPAGNMLSDTLRERAMEAGVEVLAAAGENAITGKKMDWRDTGTQALSGALLPGENRLGRVFTGAGSNASSTLGGLLSSQRPLNLDFSTLPELQEAGNPYAIGNPLADSGYDRPAFAPPAPAPRPARVATPPQFPVPQASPSLVGAQAAPQASTRPNAPLMLPEAPPVAPDVLRGRLQEQQRQLAELLRTGTVTPTPAPAPVAPQVAESAAVTDLMRTISAEPDEATKSDMLGFAARKAKDPATLEQIFNMTPQGIYEEQRIMREIYSKPSAPEALKQKARQREEDYWSNLSQSDAEWLKTLQPGDEYYELSPQAKHARPRTETPQYDSLAAMQSASPEFVMPEYVGPSGRTAPRPAPVATADAPRIERVNSGIDQRRVQEGQPPFFVNWQENGENKYAFFSQVAPVYKLKERLEAMQEQPRPRPTPSANTYDSLASQPAPSLPEPSAMAPQYQEAGMGRARAADSADTNPVPKMTIKEFQAWAKNQPMPDLTEQRAERQKEEDEKYQSAIKKIPINVLRVHLSEDLANRQKSAGFPYSHTLGSGAKGIGGGGMSAEKNPIRQHVILIQNATPDLKRYLERYVSENKLPLISSRNTAEYILGKGAKEYPISEEARAEVLADYPDLAQKYSKQTPAPTPKSLPSATPLKVGDVIIHNTTTVVGNRPVRREGVITALNVDTDTNGNAIHRYEYSDNAGQKKTAYISEATTEGWQVRGSATPSATPGKGFASRVVGDTAPEPQQAKERRPFIATPAPAPVRFSVDVPSKSVKTEAMNPSLSASAFKGADALYFWQGDIGQVLFNAKATVGGQAPPATAIEAANLYTAAEKAGYRRTNYRAGNKGTVWVMEKDGRILTRRGAEALLKGQVIEAVEDAGKGRESAQPIVNQIGRFLDALPEGSINSLNALTTAFNRTPLASQVRINRSENGRLRVDAYGLGWYIYEPESGHTPEGRFSNLLDSSVARFIEKLRYMADNPMGEGRFAWLDQDRAADKYALAKVPAGSGATYQGEQPVNKTPETLTRPAEPVQKTAESMQVARDFDAEIKAAQTKMRAISDALSPASAKASNARAEFRRLRNPAKQREHSSVNAEVYTKEQELKDKKEEAEQQVAYIKAEQALSLGKYPFADSALEAIQASRRNGGRNFDSEKSPAWRKATEEIKQYLLDSPDFADIATPRIEEIARAMLLNLENGQALGRFSGGKLAYNLAQYEQATQGQEEIRELQGKAAPSLPSNDPQSQAYWQRLQTIKYQSENGAAPEDVDTVMKEARAYLQPKADEAQAVLDKKAEQDRLAKEQEDGIIKQARLARYEATEAAGKALTPQERTKLQNRLVERNKILGRAHDPRAVADDLTLGEQWYREGKLNKVTGFTDRQAQYFVEKAQALRAEVERDGEEYIADGKRTGNIVLGNGNVKRTINVPGDGEFTIKVSTDNLDTMIQEVTRNHGFPRASTMNEFEAKYGGGGSKETPKSAAANILKTYMLSDKAAAAIVENLAAAKRDGSLRSPSEKFFTEVLGELVGRKEADVMLKPLAAIKAEPLPKPTPAPKTPQATQSTPRPTAKPAPSVVATEPAGQTETRGDAPAPGAQQESQLDQFNAIMKSLGQGEPAPTTESNAKYAPALIKSLSETRKRLEAELADWSQRRYKDNRKTINLQGDGPTRNESIGIGTINQRRKAATVENLTESIDRISRIEKTLNTPGDSDTLIGQILQEWKDAENADAVKEGRDTQEAIFEYNINKDLLKIRYDKGSVGTTDASRALLDFVKAQAPKPAQAPASQEEVVKSAESETVTRDPWDNGTLTDEQRSLILDTIERARGSDRINPRIRARLSALATESNLGKEWAGRFEEFLLSSKAEESPTPEPASDSPYSPTIPPLSATLLRDSHRGTSFDPERRAQMEESDYRRTLEQDWEYLSALATTDEVQETLREEFDRYAKGYASRVNESLAAHGRIISVMITGPARFPVARNEKANESYRKKLNEESEFRKKALAAIKRKIAPETGPIMAGDKGAVNALQKQYQDAVDSQESMKAANAITRRYYEVSGGYNSAENRPYSSALKKGKSEAAYLAEMKEAGFTETQAKELSEPGTFGNVGFAPFSLSNNNANIARIKGRIDQIQAMKAKGDSEQTWSGGIRVEEDSEDARIRIFFPGKPTSEQISALKSAGMRWSPTNGAWQRQLNGNGQWAVKRVLQSMGYTPEAKPEPIATEETDDDIPEAIRTVQAEEEGAPQDDAAANTTEDSFPPVPYDEVANMRYSEQVKRPEIQSLVSRIEADPLFEQLKALADKDNQKRIAQGGYNASIPDDAYAIVNTDKASVRLSNLNATEQKKADSLHARILKNQGLRVGEPFAPFANYLIDGGATAKPDTSAKRAALKAAQAEELDNLKAAVRKEAGKLYSNPVPSPEILRAGGKWLAYEVAIRGLDAQQSFKNSAEAIRAMADEFGDWALLHKDALLESARDFWTIEVVPSLKESKANIPTWIEGDEALGETDADAGVDTEPEVHHSQTQERDDSGKFVASEVESATNEPEQDTNDYEPTPQLLQETKAQESAGKSRDNREAQGAPTDGDNGRGTPAPTPVNPDARKLLTIAVQQEIGDELGEDITSRDNLKRTWADTFVAASEDFDALRESATAKALSETPGTLSDEERVVAAQLQREAREKVRELLDKGDLTPEEEGALATAIADAALYGRAIVQTGSELGRGLNFSRALMDDAPGGFMRDVERASTLAEGKLSQAQQRALLEVARRGERVQEEVALRLEERAQASILEAQEQAREAAIKPARHRRTAASPKSASYGATNEKYTRERYEEAKKRAQAILTGRDSKPNQRGATLLDDAPVELMRALVDIGGFHFEAGLKRYADWADQVREDIGETISDRSLGKVWNKIVTESRRFMTSDEYKAAIDSRLEQMAQTGKAPATRTRTTNPLLDQGVAEYAKGARSLEAFTRGLENRLGESLPEPILRDLFKEAARKYSVEKGDVQKVKQELSRKINAALLANRPSLYRLASQVLQAKQKLIALKATFDISFLGRQGGKIVATRPDIGAKALSEGMQALRNPVVALALDGEILAEAEAYGGGDHWKKIGLDFTLAYGEENTEAGKLDGPVWTWLKEHGIERSEEANRTILNRLRLDYFKRLAKPGDPVAYQKAMAALVNIMSSRSYMGEGETKGKVTSIVSVAHDYLQVWSPRNNLSNLQFISGTALVKPLVGSMTMSDSADRAASLRAAGRVTAEYARYAATVGTTLAILAGLAKSFGWEDWLQVDMNPRSKDFGRVRVGMLELDFTSGWRKHWAFLSEMAGLRQDSAFDIAARGKGAEAEEWREPDRGRVVDSYTRSMLNPLAGEALTQFKGRDFKGSPVKVYGLQEDKNGVPRPSFNPAQAAVRAGLLVGPISITNWAQAIAEQGSLPKETAAWMAVAMPFEFIGLGASVRNRKPEAVSKQREKDAEERKGFTPASEALRKMLSPAKQAGAKAGATMQPERPIVRNPVTGAYEFKR